MAKRKTAFVCSDCGAEFPRWQGQCNDCQAWNTLTEVVIGNDKHSPERNLKGYAGQTHAKVETLDKIDLAALPRFTSDFKELDRVLGVALCLERRC